MLELVDTHCHIQSSDTSLQGEGHTQKLWKDAGNPSGDELVTAAREAGVTRLVCVGCTLPDSRLVADFVKDRERCWASIGIHPHEAKHYVGDSPALNKFAVLAGLPKVIAVGECGLDYYYNHSPKADQIKILKFQIELAIRHGLPLIFHVREAFDDFWPVFDGYKGLRGVLHSYTDSPASLEEAMKRGLYIGVNGIATFNKNPELREVHKKIPLDKLVLETDSPFLTPHPHRGKINQPKYVLGVADFLARLRGESIEELAAATTANARELFGI